MDLLARLTEDMKAALKAGQKDRLSVIRMMLSDVKNIDLDPKKPTAEQVVEAYGKKLRKSQEEFQKLGKAEQVEQLQREIAVVDEYLEEAFRLGFKALRIVHGRGIGAQREMVRKVLASKDFVIDFRDAPAEAGGWGR